MGEIIKIACATDDGIDFSKEHFGSAKKYLVYSLDLENGMLKFLKEIKNQTPEEKVHGDPEKARAVSNELKEMKVLVNSFFGPNIVRMRKKFVPIVSNEKNIKKALEKIKQKCDEIKSSLNQTGDKNILYI